jgi:hypothetical protein
MGLLVTRLQAIANRRNQIRIVCVVSFTVSNEKERIMKNSIYDMIGALLVALTIPAMMIVGIIADSIFHLV